MRYFCLLLCLLTPCLAKAANSVVLSSTVFLEKTVADANGRQHVVLEEPKVVTPGDRLVFILNYRNVGNAPASEFIVTNPLPSAVSYQGSGESAEVSIDGGKSWGALAVLRKREPDGSWRAARPEDVTHVRWALNRAIPAGAEGRLSFRGVVR